MPFELHGSAAPIKTWIPLHDIGPSAIDQLRAVGNLPWVTGVAVMPDVHAGVGATVGSVIAMRDAVAPSAVGVDIGCSMLARRTALTRTDLAQVDLAKLRHDIERTIPTGFNKHDRPLDTDVGDLWIWAGGLSPAGKARVDVARHQLGTLGQGNHFIELCLDLDDRVWFMVHSGSRNIGKSIAEAHIAAAKKLPHNKALGELAVVLKGTPEFEAYWFDLQWAQRYAGANCSAMAELLAGVLHRTFGQPLSIDRSVACHHNYAAIEHELIITRKGAISARAGERGIIPGSMGTRSYIVRGLGNPEAYFSASHGAGRRMSRGNAKRMFTVEDVVTQTLGVECRKDAGIADELPAAYKAIDWVMAQQPDLVSVEHELRAVLCVKG